MRFSSFTVFCVFLSVFLTGCASYRTKEDPQTPAKTAQPKRTETISPGMLPPSEGALWEVLNSEQVSLQLKNVDSGKNLTVNLAKGLSTSPVPVGHWEITGFEENGKSFLSMNISKKFVFRMKAKNNVYAGSIVIGCPQIASTDLKLLKEMNFYNRYPFSSASGLCEMVIGDNFARVRKTLKKSSKNKKLNLIMGF